MIRRLRKKNFMDSNGIYLLLYFCVILFFVILGCYMLAQRDNILSTHGEQEAKRRMTNSVGFFMFVWALQCMVYLPSILRYGYEETQKGYDLCYLITVMLNTPSVFVVMHSILQKKLKALKWIGIIGLPFLALTTWHIITPAELSGRLPIYIAAVLVVIDMAYLFIRYISEYRIYIQRIKTEYSEISGREITWAWSCFAGFALQSLLYIVYQFYWSVVVEYVYMAFSIINATYLCYCVSHQKTLDSDVVEEKVAGNDAMEEKSEPKAEEEQKEFYSVIEEKLEALCEGKMLYLEPDLTRESLCLRLSIGRTYLSMYLRSRGLTFYQYINSLRVDYAVKLMHDNPDMPIREVCELSGFRSQTTFRKVFQEVMGCLPSEIKSKNNLHE